MIQVEAFQEFRAGLAFLRGGDANKALPHLQSALEEEPANPFYISYMGVAIAATEQKWADAEELCRSAIRMSRRQAQLYLNLAEVYVALQLPGEAQRGSTASRRIRAGSARDDARGRAFRTTRFRPPQP